jgi:hypothetical protein
VINSDDCFIHSRPVTDLDLCIIEIGSYSIKNKVLIFTIHISREETVRFSYLSGLRVEGKQMHILSKVKTLLETASCNYCRWEIMFVVWKIYTALSAAFSSISNPPAFYL